MLTLEGVDTTFNLDPNVYRPASPAMRLAYTLVNDSTFISRTHPRTGEKSSLYSLLCHHSDPLTPREVAELYLDHCGDPDNPDGNDARWSAHYENRLAYERAMLANEGGTAADAEMEVGGWINTRGGWVQIAKVNKSAVTGKVVSVAIAGGRPINIERLPEGAYRAPTDEERKEFAETVKAEKVAKKAAAPKAPSLINPTNEDAERLQAEWNAEAKREANQYASVPESQVWYMTQAEYSARSKGDYGPCRTSEISEKLQERRNSTLMGRDPAGRMTAFKVRTGGSGTFTGARRVVVLTDKPQKPIPWDDVAALRATMPSEELMRPRLWELAEALSADWLDKVHPEMRTLIDDAIYIGWAYISSMTQFGFTKKGEAEFQKIMAEIKPEAVLV